MRCHSRGIGLFELVIGIAILSVLLGGVTLFFYGQQQSRLDPVFQYRAVSLAEALGERILAVKYDHANDPDSQFTCAPDSCTPVASFGPEAGEDFDDVDDFHAWCGADAIAGDQLAAAMMLDGRYYREFSVSVCVGEGVAAEYKRVEIAVTSPMGGTIGFDLRRYNIR